MYAGAGPAADAGPAAEPRHGRDKDGRREHHSRSHHKAAPSRSRAKAQRNPVESKEDSKGDQIGMSVNSKLKRRRKVDRGRRQAKVVAETHFVNTEGAYVWRDLDLQDSGELVVPEGEFPIEEIWGWERLEETGADARGAQEVAGLMEYQAEGATGGGEEPGEDPGAAAGDGASAAEDAAEEVAGADPPGPDGSDGAAEEAEEVADEGEAKGTDVPDEEVEPAEQEGSGAEEADGAAGDEEERAAAEEARDAAAGEEGEGTAHAEPDGDVEAQEKEEAATKPAAGAEPVPEEEDGAGKPAEAEAKPPAEAKAPEREAKPDDGLDFFNQNLKSLGTGEDLRGKKGKAKDFDAILTEQAIRAKGLHRETVTKSREEEIFEKLVKSDDELSERGLQIGDAAPSAKRRRSRARSKAPPKVAEPKPNVQSVFED